MIAVQGGATAESGNLRVRVAASGATLTATIDGASSVVEALRNLRSIAPIARSIVPMLVRAGLTLEVVVGGVRVARAGADVDSNPVARLLRVGNIKIGR
jgi:hypothetical protein